MKNLHRSSWPTRDSLINEIAVDSVLMASAKLPIFTKVFWGGGEKENRSKIEQQVKTFKQQVCKKIFD